MPRQLLSSRVPVDLSVVELDLDSGEELFLTYTWERREGPGIVRDGIYAPHMERVGGDPGETTAHPFGLRLGSWLIQETMRGAEKAHAEEELRRARGSAMSPRDREILRDTLDELDRVHSHDGVFKDRCPGWELIAQQGCGDLTMNAWNVAYVANALTENQSPALIHLPAEPLEHRTYSCLVKWKAFAGARSRMSIEEVFFRRPAHVRDPNDIVRVRHGGHWLPRGEHIELAVSNQQVLRDGSAVPAVAVCQQFGDIRHLLQVVNLNPDAPLYPREPRRPGGGYRPREYFNRPMFHDLWFGENAIVQDPSGNLLHAALAGPVYLEPPPGATEQRLRGALGLAGYRESMTAHQPLSPGDWRFLRRGGNHLVAEVYLRRAVYGWSMIGLSKDNRRLYWLACTGNPRDRVGYRLEEAAALLAGVGAHNALLIDEGLDVFQLLRGSDGHLRHAVPANPEKARRRLRATFIAARRGGEDGSGGAAADRGVTETRSAQERPRYVPA